METILIVDDTPCVLAVLGRILLNEGYTVLAAADGPAALDAAARWQDRIDLLITDVAMSPMSCTMLVEGVQAQHPAIRVIFVSGHGRDVAARFGVRSDAFFLQKPFSPEELAQAVRQALAGSPTGPPVSVTAATDRIAPRAT